MIGDLEAVLRVDDEDLAFLLDAQRFTDELQLVDENRDVELLRLRFDGRGVARVLRVDHVEEDALVGVGRLELLEFGGRWRATSEPLIWLIRTIALASLK